MVFIFYMKGVECICNQVGDYSSRGYINNVLVKDVDDYCIKYDVYDYIEDYVDY